MTVLILNAHKGFFENFNSKIKFEKSTVHTSSFQISFARFKKLYTHVVDNKLNPFAIMNW